MFTCFSGTNLGGIFMATEEYISREFSMTIYTKVTNCLTYTVVFSFVTEGFSMVNVLPVSLEYVVER